MLTSQDIASWRVLLVDDEPDNLHLAGEVLRLSGATTWEAASGQELLTLKGHSG